MGAMGLDEIAKELAVVEAMIADLPEPKHYYEMQQIRRAQRRAEMLRRELKRLRGAGEMEKPLERER